ncbi:MAG TPA: SGNH/GDSL hydrolase family protein [Polyangia bacterium]|nr:SGNH/GDSL hydrolase family protein [Polyangia bacterium]
MSSHLVLLGDSIFDNRAYTAGEPDVVSHLREALPPGWRASLAAIDGSTTADLEEQCADVPSDATHVVVSIGGNDALANANLLRLPVRSTAEALLQLGERLARFERSYRAAIAAAVALGRDTTICTIYNGNIPAPEAAVVRVALMTFNDVILRVAFERGLRIIDLRLICTEPSDYANPIEPSGPGGRKIAWAIARAVGAAGDRSSTARVHIG